MHVCTYVCMYVCMYACMYVHMYVCMYVCTMYYVCIPTCVYSLSGIGDPHYFYIYCVFGLNSLLPVAILLLSLYLRLERSSVHYHSSFNRLSPGLDWDWDSN